MEGQHRSPIELICTNVKGVLNGVISTLEGHGCSNSIGYAQYKVDWLIGLFLRIGGGLEESILPHLLQAKQVLSISDDQEEICGIATPPLLQTGLKGRPRFDISLEQLSYLLDNGFKVTDIASLLCVSSKTVYRRLEENGLSVRGTYARLTDTELDDMVKSILQEFPNSGYKSMLGHLLSKGLKVQEYRVREAMRRADREGTIVRALQIRVTHRRSYNVRAPLALWHMDGNHKLRRLVYANSN